MLLTPEAIDDARRSGVLDLSGQNLASVPEWALQLSALRELKLDDNKLTELPPEIAGLPALEILDLSNNQLTSVPAELGELRELRSLDLSDNTLDGLPDGLSGLSRLHSLILDRNRLSLIPRPIPELTALEELWLEDNLLKELPAGIGRLRNLRQFRLSRNHLTSLPEQICSLGKLRTLRLDGNHLTTLPAGMEHLASLRRLTLDGNPLRAPVPGEAKHGTTVFAAYVRDLNAPPGSEHTAKVLLLGERYVGKTSLAAAMRGEPFSENREPTSGIAVRELCLPHPKRGDASLGVRLWDFGGQEEYRVTHQVFLSRRAVYLIVWNTRQGWGASGVPSQLRAIRHRLAGPGRAGSPEVRVLIVGTHSAAGTPGGPDRAAIDVARLDSDYAELDSEFPGMIAGHFEVDSATGAGIGQLRDAVAREAAGLPHMNLPLVVAWTAARREFLQAARETPFLHFDDFTQICQRHEVPVEDADDLARLMHDTGQIARFSGDKELQDFVVLDPERLTGAIGLVLTDQPTQASGGILEHARLRAIWDDEDRYPVSHHPHFLKAMEALSLSYRFGDHDRSLVPQMVPANRPDIPWDFGTPLAGGKRALRLRCHLDEPVTGLIALLTARLRRMSTGLNWRSGVFLRHQRQDYDSEGLIELLGDRVLCLEVRAPVPDLLFHVLTDSAEELLRERWPGLGYTLSIPCTGVGTDGVRCMAEFKLDTLHRRLAQGRTTVTCAECDAKLNVEKLLTGISGGTAAVRNTGGGTASGLINAGSLARKLSLLPEILHEQQRLEHRMTFVADSMHTLLGAINNEVTDCPRLFTLEPVNPHGFRKLEIHKRHFDLVLWCEYPDGAHPLTGHGYYVGEPREWFEKIRPYLKVTLQLLRIASPAAGVVAGLVTRDSDGMQGVGDSFKAMGELLEHSEKMADAVLHKAVDDEEAESLEQVDESAQDSPDGQPSGLTPAEGAALRAFRELLLKLDPYRNFGGLGRALASTGNYLWLCAEHLHVYNPGLPSLPAEAPPPAGPPPGGVNLPYSGVNLPYTGRSAPSRPFFTPAER
ncbi:MAG TPA: COR domain-containing protein [Trebonia sp.]